MGCFISDAEKRRSLDFGRAAREMSREAVFGGNVRTTSWRHGGFLLMQLHHETEGPPRQPVHSSDGSLTLFLDGEIFNHDVSRRAARDGAADHPDPYTGQAEYCLDNYLKSGLRGLERLNGSFVIVAYDRMEEEILVFSDRFGSRPLYYHAGSKGIAFGTQLGPVLSFPDTGRELDLQSVFEFFTYQKVLEERTFLKGISLLAPSTVLRFRGGRLEFRSYWRMEYEPDYTRSRKECSALLAETVRDAVKARLRGDYRMGILLSGGLDSRSVLAASRDRAKLEAITVADRYNREVKIASEIAKAAGCNHHFIQRPYDHYVDLVDDAVKIGGGMYRFDHAHYVGLFDLISDHCDVLLHGFDPEVLFRAVVMPRKGYHLFGIPIMSGKLMPLSEDSLVDAVLESLPYSLWNLHPMRLFTPAYSGRFEPMIRDSTARVLAQGLPGTSIHNRYDWFTVNHRLRLHTALFVLSIRPFMIERSITSDNRLLDLYLSIPPEHRADPLLWAHALKYLDPAIARIRDSNTGLPPFPPFTWMITKNIQNILKRSLKKLSKGYAGKWYTRGSWPDFPVLTRRNERLKNLILATIEDADCLHPSLFDTGRIGELARLHFAGAENHTTELFLLVTFGRWHKLYCA